MLELRDISLTLESDKGSVDILRNINIVFQDNLLYVLTGPNGGGKSSLAKVIMGIYQPTSGKIFLDGQDITGLGVTERARLGIGYAFQQPPRFKGITVGELLKISQGKRLDYAGETSGARHNFLSDVGLCPNEYMDREVDNSLSGGELKRIEIASLLSRRLKAAVYDEPEAGIDLWSFTRLTETFRNVHRTTDTTLILISHQERILSLADEIIVIVDGTIGERGGREQIMPTIMGGGPCSYREDCLEGSDENADCYR